MKCAGGVKIVRHKPCPECGAKSNGPCPVALANEREAFLDMLAALKYAVDNIQGIMDGNDIPSTAIRDMARAAIAKAESI